MLKRFVAIATEEHVIGHRHLPVKLFSAPILARSCPDARVGEGDDSGLARAQSNCQRRVHCGSSKLYVAAISTAYDPRASTLKTYLKRRACEGSVRTEQRYWTMCKRLILQQRQICENDRDSNPSTRVPAGVGPLPHSGFQA
jgi:hypothetical protein